MADPTAALEDRSGTLTTLPPSACVRAYAAERWARAIMGVVECSTDLRTTGAWARVIGASGGALRSWCRAAHAPAKSSLDLGRFLRAILLSRQVGWDPQNLLDVVDERTLRRLFARAGVSETSAEPPTVEAFLGHQRLVRDPVALRALVGLLVPAFVDSNRAVAPPPDRQGQAG